MGKGLDSSCITPSFGRVLSVRLVIIGTIIVIVPLFASLLFKALTLLTPVFDPVVCIAVVDNIMEVSVIPVSPSAMFLRWSETTSRVPTRTLSVVKLMTPCFVITVKCWVNHGCYIQHLLEAPHVCINFFIILWQVGSELIDEHP
jgi:hypothetical protein